MIPKGSKKWRWRAAAEEAERKSAVLGALALYLDFSSFFLTLLRILGRSKR